jgi:hypothetical protein
MYIFLLDIAVASTMDDARPTQSKVASVFLSMPVSNANSESKTLTILPKRITTICAISKKTKSKTAVMTWFAFTAASVPCCPNWTMPRARLPPSTGATTTKPWQVATDANHGTCATNNSNGLQAGCDCVGAFTGFSCEFEADVDEDYQDAQEEQDLEQCGAYVCHNGNKSTTKRMTLPMKAKRVEMIVASTVSMEDAVMPWK